MVKYVFSAAVAGMLMVSGCQSSSGPSAEARVVQQNIGSVNPYLWRASLDTFENMPVATADPIGGLINYDWKSFETAPNERIKATVYILDTRLRADGVKVSVFRQEKNESGEWVDVSVDPETALQLENKILDRARLLKNSQLG
ncbi:MULTISPECIES: DUF3576 domain-containing protein [Hyphomonas]|jgi:hypothetical protein|uniref:DUF3576 domain-containing protein n=1 Tax=Hyphomonas atlantica TaxID=1280948 RepID=A0A356W7E0_9PROT|nr:MULTISPECIES: DUF3576 domain-containing protein [Hyphomonas]MAH91671.1 hypothetical protein [Hyphomonas sp.]MAM08404.1 hypothetical protein [Hyphomonas sp.]OUX90186.1 MAG: hypothetical protein CBB91_00640 [Hyphomonas sp. TMED31]HBQ49253.1 DUF3576 domain-containing protein [Hyphomonas atlantica]|tara:strand:- start:585 stop:1013 length:429 start_codon:yes stop_codon:yes gene_type:complete